ncbi:MAG: RNA polymerase sigma-70 factor [Bacteroidota bacterium]|jgi:RNA polymerase sigma-70 factor, ECF subfamily
MENSKEKALFELKDIKAFEMLFNQYYKPLVNYSFTFLKDPGEAEDVVQQVYINVWQKRDELDIHTSLRAFLYKSVHNACLNRIKQMAVRESYAADSMRTATVEHTADVVVAKELKQKIDDAIDQLPEQCGKIFKMSRYGNLKYQQIADTLGISVKTVENQMGKALKILRTELKEYMPLLILFTQI